MQQSRSYINDFKDFFKKLKMQTIPKDAIMVTADLVGLYFSISHGVGLEALRKRLGGRVNKRIGTEDLIEMAEFVLKNNYFELNSKVKQQLSATIIGTNGLPPYSCIFMDQVETDFLGMVFENIKCLLLSHGQEKLRLFLEGLNKCHPNINFNHETNKEDIAFLYLKVKLLVGKISQICLLKLQTVTNFFIRHLCIQNRQSVQNIS